MEHYSPYYEMVDGCPVIIDRERLDKDWARVRGNLEYLSSHYHELLEKYPDQWVAVYQNKVVATDLTQEGLLDRLEELGLRSKVGMSQYAAWFMDTKPTNWIL